MNEPASPCLAINLTPRETTCVVCGVDLTDAHQAVPVYEDQLLPNDWPGDWGGFDACRPCYDYQGTLTAPVGLENAKRAIKAVEAVSDAVLPSPRPEWATRGGRLRYARQNAGLSIGQVGALLGIKGATVRTWEDAEVDPGPPILDSLGEYYGTATTFLESGAVAIIPPSLRATLRLLPDDEARAVIDLLSTLRSEVSS